MRKLIYIALIPLLLASCSASSISSTSSSDSASDSSSSGTSDAYCFSLNGIKNDGDTIIHFMNDLGWSMAGGKVDDNQFKITYKDGTGFIKSPTFESVTGNTYVDIKMHITNFDSSKTSTIGKTLCFTVEALSTGEEESVVEKYTYSRVIAQEDLDNGAPYQIPTYSSDFSSGAFRVPFSSSYSRVRINLVTKLMIDTSNGCNLAINEIKISK